MAFKLTYRDDALSELSAACIVKQLVALTESILGSSPHDLVQGLPARLPKSLLSAEGIVPAAPQEVENQQDRSQTDLLHHQFEAQAACTPDRLALSFHSSLDSPPVEMSYAELDARANGLANILREENVDIIPICMQRSADLYVAILAILKAGSAWCPIDETSPIQRRTSLIARTMSKVLLTTTESLSLVEPCLAQESLKGMRVIFIDQYANLQTPVRTQPRDAVGHLRGVDLAYLLWTSGTTGEPKGVMIPHSAAAAAMRDLQVQVEHDPQTPQVRTLQLSAYSFDVFVQDLFYTWGLAGAVISGTRELILGTFVEFIWKSRPTHAHLTPSFGASINVEEIRGSTLQYVTFIGEKLTEDVAEAWAAPEITTRAYNTYGPAENAVVSTMRRFYGKSHDQAKAANVGFPLGPCTAYVVREVLDSENKKRWELVPRYGVGELALGGAQVAKGYLGNKAKTTKAFIQGGAGIDERIYLTGDMVRLNDHGFEFLGRNDDLVKITGIRIELSEISAACASVKDEEAAVEHVETLYLPRPGADTDGSNKVVVTFVSVKKDGVDTGTIRKLVFQRARDMLPTYMVPGHVVVLAMTMPRTASNKVDRKALQEIYTKSDLNVLAGRDCAEQVTGQEQQTAQWTQEQLPVLHMIAQHFKVAAEPLAQGDSLAGLGFSSLQVTKLAWSLRRQLKCEIGVLDLMRCQFLGELVDVVLSKLPGQKSNELQGDSASSAAGEGSQQATGPSWVSSTKDLLTKNLHGDMRPQDIAFVLPATPMQESLVVETMLEPKAYWAHRVFDLSHLGEIDRDRLKESWTAVARTYDILRTIFVPLTQLDVVGANSVSWAREHGIRSTILQLVLKQPIVRWTWLSRGDDQSLASRAEKLQIELAPTNTDQPPWAVTFAEGESKMMLSMHHALYDNVSSEILLDTLARLYVKRYNSSDKDIVVQLERGMELGLLPSPAQRDEAASLWNQRLSDLRKTAGALNAPFPDLTQSRQKQPQRILLSRKAVPTSFLASRSGAPALPTLLQSAFGCVLASYLELKAVVFGQNVSQRILHPDLARVVGPAMATLPVVIRADAASAEELWGEMDRDSSTLFRSTHDLHPVDLKKMLNQDTGSSDAPFPALFVYHPANMEDGEDHSTMFSREIEQALSLNVEHPLAFNIFEGEGAMELTGDGRRISQSQLDLLLEQIIEQARIMMEAPQIPLAQLQNKMSRGLLSISGETSIQRISTVDPSESVAMYASSHPEWIAAEEIIFQESDDDEDTIVTKTVTYAQLDKITNAIACRLTSHEAGLRSDDVVAMLLGRDIKSLATTLAIFRAGFVYLPVDEDLPPTRKQLLISDAKAKLVVTTEAVARDLSLGLDSDSPELLLLDDGNDDVERILSWPISKRQTTSGDGGYLIYTSGSTGRPKGVRVSNSNLCHFIAAFSARLMESSAATAHLGGAGKYLNLTSRAFDPHLTQLFVPWHLGHRVVIGKDRTAMLGNLQHVIKELGVTHFGSVPSVLTQLRLRPEDVPSVRVVTTGGEKASSELLDTWSQPSSVDKDQEVVLYNFYGPTEVTIGCLGHPVDNHSNARNLGLPLRGLQALLLDPNAGEEQIITRRGQPGELCIAGPQVAMGYLDRPSENAKSFQTTALLVDGEQRIYRTGDMMRMMHDGTLEFLGRADQQAKIRGQRLELDEVVSFLKDAAAGEGGLDFAAAVVATGLDAANQQQQLFGFAARKASSLLKGEAEAEVELLLNQGRAVTALLEKLEDECQKGLPVFMVPTMVWVSRIPYLPASGKVDTKLLAKLANDYVSLQEGHQDDETAVVGQDVSHALDAREAVVVAAVEEAVGSKVKATVTTSIHRLGIDSLSAVHLVSLLRKQGFSKLSMVDVLSTSSTVGSIARVADPDSESGAVASSASADVEQRLQQVKALSTKNLGPIPAGLSGLQVEAVLPCLPLQAALVARSLVWLSTNNGGEEAAVDVPYVAHFHYRLSGGTDIAKWKKAAELVVASEAMLRTSFVQREDDGRVFQVVLRSLPFSPFDGPFNSTDIVAKMNVRPPIRLEVRENEESGEIVASLRIHHALFDGVAIDVLRRRVEQAYHGEAIVSASDNHSLETLTRISAHCSLSASQMESTQTLWQTKLSGARPCHVGARVDANRDSGNMARSTLCLAWTTSQLKSKLHSRSVESGVSISASAAFQLATALCLARLTRQTSIVFGFVMSLRPLLDHISDGVDEFVGPCLNTLVQALSFDRGDETLPKLAHKVQESHVAACQGTMPFVSVEQVQRWTTSEDKLFDSLLSINIVPADVAMSGEPAPGRMSALRTESKSDMALAIDIDLHANGKIVLTLSSAGALNEAELEDVGRMFEKVVYSTADEDARVRDFVTLDHEVAAPGFHTADDIAPDLDVMDEEFEEAWKCVQTILCRLLRLKPADMPDKTRMTSLYQLGLDSITVLPFVRLLQKSEKIKLAPDAVIKARTIQGTARLVQEARRSSQTSAVITSGTQDLVARRGGNNNSDRLYDEHGYDKTLERLGKNLLFVATPLQEGMLSASLAIAGKAYTYVHTMQLSKHALEADTPQFDAFFAAIQDTVQSCDILRTRFLFTQDDEAPWVGVVSPTEMSDLVRWEAVQPHGRIQLTIHHALYDATSLEAMWRIVGENYRRRLAGEDHGHRDEEAAPRHLFRPFAREVASNQSSSVAFWMDLVQDYSYTPLDFVGESLGASSAFYFTLDAQALSLLQTRCREASVTTKAALQLAWAKVLCESVYGQPDVVYGEVVTTGGGETTENGGGMVGPTINTVPMRVRLVGPPSVAEGLAGVQKLSDDARGPNSMASLRKIQTAWRSGSGQEHGAASLFESLFVFDGIVDSEADGERLDPPLFKSAPQTKTQTGEDAEGPAYDDYPLIVSFHIKNKTLHGKLRAKMTQQEVESLGRRLEAAVQEIVLEDLQRPALDLSQMEAVRERNLSRKGSSTVTNGTTSDSETNGFTTKADAVLEVVKKVLGTRCQGKELTYDTRLISAGLDSILAIRLSSLLRKRMGLTVSVFDIIKGASVHDMVKKTTSGTTTTPKATTEQAQAQAQARARAQSPPSAYSDELKSSVANKLGLSEYLIQSIHPVLPGQRAHLDQWLLNGKRFLESPWVYRLADSSVNSDTVSKCWTELCRIHDVLRSTFVYSGPGQGLVQVTLTESWSGGFAAVQESSLPIEDLIESHVRDENSKVSDLRSPAARLSFVEGSDGKAIVLRVHHALYDAWSIKMIARDLNALLAFPGHTLAQTPLATSFETTIRQVTSTRQPAAEDAYWTQHLLNAQETILHASNNAVSSSASPLGPHFKASYPSLLPLNTVHPRISPAIILAFARTLAHFTHRSQPTFGLHHASRSLAGLDLTAARGPLLTVTPFTVDLSSSPSSSADPDEQLLGLVQTHLAQLTNFAQAEGLDRFCPRYNTYLNILYPGETRNEEEAEEGKGIIRHRLSEPLASEYFTTTAPSASTVSTIDGLEMPSYLCTHRLFFNVIVRSGEGVSVAVSGDEELVGGDKTMVQRMVEVFRAELRPSVEGLGQ